MALAKGYTDQQLKERNAAIRTAKASGASRADLNVLRTGTPTKAPVVKKNPVAVVSSGAAKKNIQEVVRPALEEAKAGMEAQSAALANAKIADEQKAAALSTSKIDDATKQAKLEEIKQKALLIQKELNTPDESTTEAANQAINPTPTGEVATPPTDNSSSAPTVSDTLTNTQAAYQKALQEYEQKADAVSKTILSIQNGSVPLSAGEKAQVKGLEQQFKSLIDQQKLVNAGASGMASVRGYQTGAAEYDPNFTVRTIGSIVTAGMNKVADLNIRMSSAVAELEQAFKDNKISAIKDSFAIFKEASEARRTALKDTIEQAQAEIAAAQAAQEKRQEKVNAIVISAAENGAPPDVIAAMSNAGSVGEAIAYAGDYLQKGTGTVGEYLYYKRTAIANGQVPMDYNAYADMDANRKRTVINMGGTGLYSSAQEKVITRIDNSIAGNDMYKKYNSMTTFANNVNTALAAGNGVSDIAAINQFQKVIDEGAVTRDQDVKLIQGAQSLANQLSTKVNQLKNGQQLSQAQRDQMKTMVNDMLKAQKQAVDNDPFIQSKRKELERNNIDPADTIIGGIDTPRSTADEAIQNESAAEDAVTNVAASNPAAEAAITPLLGTYTYQEIMEALPEYFSQ